MWSHLRTGENPGKEGEFAVLTFIRHLLYLLRAVQGLGACPLKSTSQMRRLKVRVLCFHRKERWEPGFLAEVLGMEA